MEKNGGNYVALTPVSFLYRNAHVYPERLSLVYGTSPLQKRYTWLHTLQRCSSLASALLRHSIALGDTVSVVAPNVPAMYEVHFGVPMAGAILNTINIRLDTLTIAYIINHAQTKLVIVDQELFPLVYEALTLLTKERGGSLKPLPIIVIEDEHCPRANFEAALDKGAMSYEDFLQQGDANYKWIPPKDEWQSIAVNYTSGTTANPKGVVLSHRGAYLASLTSFLEHWSLKDSKCTFLWTVPLFHCNGWCHSWGVAAVAGTNICLRQVTGKAIYEAIAEHNVTHFGAVPVVLNMIIDVPDKDKRPIKRGVKVMTGGSAPPASVLEKMEMEGFEVTHAYGLTETYGPSTVCIWKREWDTLPLQSRSRLKARQGVRLIAQDGLDVVFPENMQPVPSNGTTIGEVILRGNIVMKGYLANPSANEECFKGGWFHTGDLAVKHPDGYIEIKDRAKDVINSGGENISSIEIESLLYRHSHVLEASVVARPDERWGESPCAFITPKTNMSISTDDIIQFCRDNLPHFKVPKSVVFGELPKTSTGKIQKHVLRARAKALGPLLKLSNSKL